MSSPHPWGCFYLCKSLNTFNAVFPTPVGVFPSGTGYTYRHPSLPHTRGGVSRSERVGPAVRMSSPHPWGCFQLRDYRFISGKVFPTPVGVFPVSGLQSTRIWRLPHTRGGVSTPCSGHIPVDASSPHPWGCFHNGYFNGN